MTDALLLRTEEAAEMLGLSRTKTCDLIRTGALPSVKIGRSRRVPVVAVEEFVASRLAELRERLEQ